LLLKVDKALRTANIKLRSLSVGDPNAALF
jgi:hypothetical protein